MTTGDVTCTCPQRAASERGIDDHGSTGFEHDTNASKDLSVDLLGERGIVGPLPRCVVDRLRLSHSEHLFAGAVGVYDRS